MTSTGPKSMRADARRNRATILRAAGELFGERGADVQMEEIAERAELGMGTLYRHFATKRALLSAIVGERFDEMIELARTAAGEPDPARGFAMLLRSYLAAAERDQAFRLAVLGPDGPDWDELAERKARFGELAEASMARAIRAGALRADFQMSDFVLITRGVMANMAAPGKWRRHLELTLEGLAAQAL